MPPGILVYKNLDTQGGMQAAILDQHPDTGLSFGDWTLQPGETFMLPRQFEVRYIDGASPARLSFAWLDTVPPAQPRLLGRDAVRLTLREQDVGTGLRYFEVSADGMTSKVKAHIRVLDGLIAPIGFTIPISRELRNQRHVRIVVVDWAGNRSSPLLTRTYQRGYAIGPRLTRHSATAASIRRITVRYSTNPLGGSTVSLRELTGGQHWQTIGSGYVLTPSVRLRISVLEGVRISV